MVGVMDITYTSDENGQCDWCGDPLPVSGPRTPRWVSNNVGVFCSESCARAGRKEWGRWPGNETTNNHLHETPPHA